MICPMRSLVALCFLITSCAHAGFVPDEKSGFVLVAGARPYYVYLPKDWQAAPHPVIVYMHGSGERGDDPARATQVGLGPVVRRSRGTFPFIVVFPQAPRGSYFGMPENNARVLAALDEVLARYHGDPDRVYLTGNSLGGYGTWFLGALAPERFAALVPICGGVRGAASKGGPFAAFPDNERPKEIARRLAGKPIWIFHGEDDWMVPVRNSREMATVLKAAGNEVRFTEYAGVGHNAWDRAYADPALWEWLLAQRRH